MPRLLAHVTALRDLKDSVNWQAIPVGTPFVAGYVPPSRFAWPPEAWARFASSIQVRITPSASVARKGIQVLDVETGDASPGHVPGWVKASRADGQEPTAYMNVATWPAVIRACTGAGVAVPQFWVADWDGVDDLPSITVDNVTYTAVAHQLADPPASGGAWDSSVVADYWPGVDQGVLDMLLSDEIKIPNGPNAGKVLADVNDTMYFTDLYAGQAATVVQDPNIGNAAIMAALKAQSTVLAQLAANAGAQVTGAQIQQWIDDAVAQHVQITGTVQVGPAPTTPAATPPAATSN